MPSPDTAGPPHATTVLKIDLGALAANYRFLANKVKPAACAAVVKADGYGLGADPVAKTLRDAGCERFFVAHLDEAIALRDTLGDGPEISVLNGLTPGTESEFTLRALIPVLNDLGQIEAWSAHCRRHGPAPAAAHLDTGMNRLGLPPAEADRLAAEPERLDGFPLHCVMSHLACADTPDHPLNRRQQRDFASTIARLPQATASLSASSGIFLGPDWHFDMARPGASLYGVAPFPGERNPMRPVVGVYGKIIQIRDVDAPQTVGYGATHQFTGSARLATIAAGYADGYLRSLGGKATAHIGDNPAPVVGRVSMDLITLDISNAPGTRLGDEVELIGPHNDLDSVAAAAGTIGYEILTSFGRRYRRIYSGNTA